jgi:3-carboxy-cis,cis-muconate cycloisomerase
MPTTVFDSALYGDVFSTPAMRAIFSEEAQIAAYVRAEAALAAAQGRTGVIPREAAEAIVRQAAALTPAPEQLRNDTATVGYPIAGLVRDMAAALGEAGRYLHWGATTQDIMDTATVLQAREGLALIDRQLDEVLAELAALARRHRDTPMAGRTHLQQALPTTLGHKLAIWLSALERSAERLRQARPRALMAQLGGAVGTLASLAEDGLAVRAAFAEELGLVEPDITWHVARDGLAELVQALALTCGVLGKIGFDVTILMATEIGEVFEPFSSHRGASSTMPQKRNPISSEILVANAKLARGAAALMLDGLVQDLERASGPWHVEWLALPQAFLLASGSLEQARFMLAGLVVEETAMTRNLDRTKGLIVAEAVMMGLAPALGRQTAHDEVYAACRDAIAADGSLLDALLRRPAIAAALPRAELAALCDPRRYLGSAGAMVDRVLARREAAHRP